MKLVVIAVLASIMLAGCMETTQEDIATAAGETQYSFNNPQEVGTLPDGRKVFLVSHSVPDSYYARHIYFVENGGTSVNVLVPHGKTTRQETTFIAPQEDVAAEQARREAAVKEEARRIATEKMAAARKLEEEAKALLSQ